MKGCGEHSAELAVTVQEGVWGHSVELAVTAQEGVWGDTVRSWQHLVRNTMLRAQGTQEQDTKMSPKLCAKSNACSKLGSVLECGVAAHGWLVRTCTLYR